MRSAVQPSAPCSLPLARVMAQLCLCPDLKADQHCSGDENIFMFHFLSIVGGRTPLASLQGWATHSPLLWFWILKLPPSGLEICR